MENININFLAVVVAAISTFLIGGLWYSPILFSKAWMRENNFTEEDLKSHSAARKFGVSFLMALIMAVNLAAFLGDKADVTFGATAGFLTGAGWVLTGIAVIGVFENKSWRYILINGGYHTVAFTVMGVILGAWH